MGCSSGRLRHGRARKENPPAPGCGGFGGGSMHRSARSLRCNESPHGGANAPSRGIDFISSDTALSENTFLADFVQVARHLAISAVSLAFLLGWPWLKNILCGRRYSVLCTSAANRSKNMSEVPPSEGRSGANLIDPILLSRLSISPTGLQPAPFRTVSAFNTPSDHIGSALGFKLYSPNLLDLRLDGATHLNRPSVIPTLSTCYCAPTRRHSPDRVIATLTH